MKRVWAGALGLWLGGLGVVGQARAEGARGAAPVTGAPDEIVAKQRATTKTFYGWQILATGEVGSVLAAASVFLPDHPLGSFGSSAGFVIGMPIYALGGPIVHWNHGDFTKGLVSFGGNATFVLGGGLIGQSVRCSKDPGNGNCGERGFFSGLAVAILIAPLLDAALLGWEDIPVDFYGGAGARKLGEKRPVRTGLSVTPTWSVGPRGSFQLGVSGAF